jgi:hypothetical protein
MLMGRTFRNPILDRLLPSLLLVNAVAILDGHLEELVASRFGSLPKGYKNSFHGRIEYLADQAVVANRAALHAIRERRNNLAHGAATAVSWTQLVADVHEIDRTLQHLGAVGTRPKLEFRYERSALREVSEPYRHYTRDFRYWVSEEGNPAYEVSWTENILPVGQQVSGAQQDSAEPNAAPDPAA